MKSVGNKNNGKIKTFTQLGINHFKNKYFQKAIKYFQKALQTDPDFKYLILHEIFYFLGESYRELNRFDMSIKYLNQAIESFDPNRGDVDIWQIHLSLARVLRASPNQNATEWLPLYNKVLQILIPKTKTDLWKKSKYVSEHLVDVLLEGYYYIGLYHLHKKDYDQAINLLIESINSNSKVQPLFTQAKFFLGRSYLYSGDNQKALKILLELLQIDPEFRWIDAAIVYYDLSEAYFNEKEYQESLEYKLKILEIQVVEPNLLSKVHLSLGHTYFALGLFRKAVEYYKECIQLTDPKSVVRRTAIEYMVKANEALA